MYESLMGSDTIIIYVFLIMLLGCVAYRFTIKTTDNTQHFLDKNGIDRSHFSNFSSNLEVLYAIDRQLPKLFSSKNSSIKTMTNSIKCKVKA